VRLEVLDLHGLLLAEDAREPGVRPGSPRLLHRLRESIGGAPLRDQMERLAVVEKENPQAGLAESRRAFEERVEHGGEIVRRAGDDPEDLARGRLLLEGLGELSGPLLYLLLEVGVGLAELTGHPVELLGEGLDLVARVDLEPVAEIAR